MIELHADVVGSLLRPAALVQARTDHDAGRIDTSALRSAEDTAVDSAIELQETAGLPVVTDGEMRRLSFQSQLVEAVDGFGSWDLDAFLWGDWFGDAGIGNMRTERPHGIGVVEKLKPRRHLSTDEFIYLRDRTGRTAKITLPSPSLFANFWSPERSATAYPRLADFLEDVAGILRAEVAALSALGAAYIQIDAPHYPLLLSPATRAFYESRGWTTEQWLAFGLELDNHVMAAAPEVTFGFHLCRGNQGSRWLVAGGYDAIARPIFGAINAERLLLEYDDDRAGSFAALRDVPEDKMVVLGLLTTKHGSLESIRDLVGRIDAAAEYFPRSQLAISPQCGFSTSVIGNNLTIEEQGRKLELVAAVAAQVWG